MSDMITGEAVLIDVPCARFPSRMVAIVIDMVIQLIVLGVVSLFVGAAAPGLSVDAGAALTLSVLPGHRRLSGDLRDPDPGPVTGEDGHGAAGGR